MEEQHIVTQVYIPKLLFHVCKQLMIDIPDRNRLILEGYHWATEHTKVTVVCTIRNCGKADHVSPNLQHVNTVRMLDKQIVYGIIGELSINNYHETNSHPTSYNSGLRLTVDADKETCECITNQPALRNTHVIIITYNPAKLLDSYFLLTSFTNDIESTGIYCLLKVLKSHNESAHLMPEKFANTADSAVIHLCLDTQSITNQAMNIMFSGIFTILSLSAVPLYFGSYIASRRYITGILLWLRRYCYTVRQLTYKFHSLKAAVSSSPTTVTEDPCRRNAVVSLLIDSLLGLIVLAYFHQYLPVCTSVLLSSTETVASELSVLLTWLMGVPGGLKLNRELNESLGKFFLYHVHLWKTYILTFIKPVLHLLVSYIMVTGCLGVTIQLTLLIDLTTLLTFHISCFYVYAARLYFIICYGLCSLWKLFRGKKWNVLRRRVDTLLHYDLDQLFLGTLLFAILLFLYPTAALYYSVFCGLHVLVLLLKQLLISAIHCVNACAWYLLLARLLASNTTVGAVYYSVRSEHECEQVNLCMKYSQSSVLTAALGVTDPSHVTWTPSTTDLYHSVPTLLYRLLWGYLTFDVYTTSTNT